MAATGARRPGGACPAAPSTDLERPEGQSNYGQYIRADEWRGVSRLLISGSLITSFVPALVDEGGECRPAMGFVNRNAVVVRNAGVSYCGRSIAARGVDAGFRTERHDPERATPLILWFDVCRMSFCSVPETWSVNASFDNLIGGRCKHASSLRLVKPNGSMDQFGLLLCNTNDLEALKASHGLEFPNWYKSSF